MKVVVDPNRCEGNMRCVEVAPDVFELGDDDQARVLIEHIGEERRAEMERAVRVCPRQAITIVEDE